MNKAELLNMMQITNNAKNKQGKDKRQVNKIGQFQYLVSLMIELGGFDTQIKDIVKKDPQF